MWGSLLFSPFVPGAKTKSALFAKEGHLKNGPSFSRENWIFVLQVVTAVTLIFLKEDKEKIRASHAATRIS